MTKGAFSLLVMAFVVWSFWMSWQWLRNKNKKGEK